MERLKAFLRKTLSAFRTAYSWLTGFGADKYMHVIAGTTVTAAFALIPHCAPFAFTAGVLAGVGKECIDKLRGERFDDADLLATIVGAAFAHACIWLYLLIF